MEQENKQMNSLPDNAYRELAPGEEYKPMMPCEYEPQGGYALFRDIRYYHGGYLFRGSSLPWVESRYKYSRLQFLSLLLLLVWAICWGRKICWDKT